MTTGGKGDKPRPFSVSQQEFDNRWDTIFSKNKKSDVVKIDDTVVREEIFDQPDCTDK